MFNWQYPVWITSVIQCERQEELGYLSGRFCHWVLGRPFILSIRLQSFGSLLILPSLPLVFDQPWIVSKAVPETCLLFFLCYFSLLSLGFTFMLGALPVAILGTGTQSTDYKTRAPMEKWASPLYSCLIPQILFRKACFRRNLSGLLGARVVWYNVQGICIWVSVLCQTSALLLSCLRRGNVWSDSWLLILAFLTHPGHCSSLLGVFYWDCSVAPFHAWNFPCMKSLKSYRTARITCSKQDLERPALPSHLWNFKALHSLQISSPDPHPTLLTPLISGRVPVHSFCTQSSSRWVKLFSPAWTISENKP